MATTPRSQAQLARDPNFLKRLESLLISEAEVKAAETPNSNPDIATKRRQLAQAILTNPAGMAQSLAPAICNATNLAGSTTTWNFEAGAAETAATDAEIRSQIDTLWNILAGV